jgi:ribonucleotide monophosphatase NagD (HAD superfamily)
MLLKVKDKSRVLAIGDSLKTDVPGATNYGIDSCLTMTGNHNEEIGVDVDINKVSE